MGVSPETNQGSRVIIVDEDGSSNAHMLESPGTGAFNQSGVFSPSERPDCTLPRFHGPNSEIRAWGSVMEREILTQRVS